MPFRRENRHVTFLTLLMVAGLMAAFAGVQLRIADREDDQRVAAAREREQADRAYADCLTDFASDLVDTLKTARKATKKLERAEAAKDEALDRLLFVTALARRIPPEATEADFDRALAARVRAQESFDEVRAEVSDLREENPYVAPEAKCTR